MVAAKVDKSFVFFRVIVFWVIVFCAIVFCVIVFYVIVFCVIVFCVTVFCVIVSCVTVFYVIVFSSSCVLFFLYPTSFCFVIFLCVVSIFFKNFFQAVVRCSFFSYLTTLNGRGFKLSKVSSVAVTTSLPNVILALLPFPFSLFFCIIFLFLSFFSLVFCFFYSLFLFNHISFFSTFSLFRFLFFHIVQFFVFFRFFLPSIPYSISFLSSILIDFFSIFFLISTVSTSAPHCVFSTALLSLHSGLQ